MPPMRSHTQVTSVRTSVLTVKSACEAPLIALKRPQVQDLDDQQVSWVRGLALCVCHRDGPAQVVHLRGETLSSRCEHSTCAGLQ